MSEDPGRLELRQLRQRVLDLEGDKQELEDRLERLERERADVSLSELVRSVALEVALGEATMPDRVVTPVAIAARGHLVSGPDGIGLRLPSTLAGDPRTLSSASFELAKVPAAEGGPRSLVAVLQQKQLAYGEAALRGGPAARLVTEIGKVLAESGSWTIPLLAGAAQRMGVAEAELADAEGDEERAKAARALSEFAGALTNRSRFAVGDLDALAAALERTTSPAVRAAG